MDIQKVERQVFKNNFVEHVFKFDDGAKTDLLNGIQYILFAVIFVTILNSALGRIMTDADESKGDVELFGEIMVHLIIMFVGLIMVDRIITFIPTYSGSEYKPINMMTLIFVFIVLQMDSESVLGRKMRMLLGRVNELWDGAREGNQNAGEQGQQGQGHGAQQGQGQQGGQQVMSSQPIAGQHSANIMAPPQQPHMQAPPQQPQQPQQAPQMQGGMQQGMMGFEPMAANASSSGFSSLF
tara:strand:- start:4900 stop:5616 length:717 start_codon:yes stop_codon:yes gene_type:complete